MANETSQGNPTLASIGIDMGTNILHLMPANPINRGVTNVITQEEAEALGDQHSQATLEGGVEAATALFTDDEIIISMGEKVA